MDGIECVSVGLSSDGMGCLGWPDLGKEGWLGLS